MPDKHTAFPFRWAFPIGELLLCAILLWPVRGELFSNRQPRNSSAPTRTVYLRKAPAPPNLDSEPQESIQATPASVQEQRAERIRQLRISIPPRLNFPAFFFDYFIYNMVPDKVRETDAFRKSWMPVTWPLYGIVFWWMAGRAVEALIAARKRSLIPRIGPPEVTVAIALLLFGGFLSLGFAFTNTPLDLDSYLLAAGAALWGLIGLLMLLARIMQWRVRKVLNTLSDAALPTS